MSVDVDVDVDVESRITQNGPSASISRDGLVNIPAHGLIRLSAKPEARRKKRGRKARDEADDK